MRRNVVRRVTYTRTTCVRARVRRIKIDEPLYTALPCTDRFVQRYPSISHGTRTSTSASIKNYLEFFEPDTYIRMGFFFSFVFFVRHSNAAFSLVLDLTGPLSLKKKSRNINTRLKNRFTYVSCDRPYTCTCYTYLVVGIGDTLRRRNGLSNPKRYFDSRQK